MTKVVGAVVRNRQRIRPFGSGRSEGHTGLIAEAHGIDLHLLMRVDAIRSLIGHLHSHDRAATGHASLDYHARLGWHANGQQCSSHPAVGRSDVQPSMYDVTTHWIVRRGTVTVLMFDPKGIVWNVCPAVVVGISEAAVAWKSKCEIKMAVFARDASVLMIPVGEIFDNQPRLGIHAIHFPDLFAVFWNVGFAVVGAVADLIHHGFKCALTDFPQKLSIFIENLHMRGLKLIRLRTAQQQA